MIPSSPKSERLAGTILIGLLSAVITIVAIWFYLYKQNEKKMIPIEDAMYVSDWNITKIYGPGTPEQANIVIKFKREGSDFFSTPILYRMGGDLGDSTEGLLIIPFDPENPEMALQLKTNSN